MQGRRTSWDGHIGSSTGGADWTRGADAERHGSPSSDACGCLDRLPHHHRPVSLKWWIVVFSGLAAAPRMRQADHRKRVRDVTRSRSGPIALGFASIE